MTVDSMFSKATDSKMEQTLKLDDETRPAYCVWCPTGGWSVRSDQHFEIFTHNSDKYHWQTRPLDTRGSIVNRRLTCISDSTS
jgi:hypothetical protein